MRKIILHGSLGAKYGKTFELDIETAAEAVRALTANFAEFARDLGEGAWHIVRGKKVSTGFDLGEDDLMGFRLGKGDLHFVPFVSGSKNSGTLKVILGIALVGISFGFAAALGAPIAAAGTAGASILGATTWANALGYIGISMALSGASALLAPQANTEGTDDMRSFVSSGPGGTTKEGVIVPIIYGKVITGGVIVSGGIDIEQLGG